MKKFRFRFETVLTVRKNRENDTLAALGAAQRAYQACLARKYAFQLQLADALVRREGLGARATPVQAFELEQAFITGTKWRITQADQGIVRASRAVEKALRAYLAARKQTRMMEVLSEKAYAEFRRELGRKESREAGDLVTMRARIASYAGFGERGQTGEDGE